MTPDPVDSRHEAATAQEVQVLREYGLRWAVLASWRDALRLRQLPVPSEVDHHLERARLKLASGCFTTCDVGCDMTAVEAMLTSVDAYSQHNWVDFWLGLLGQSMHDDPMVEFILKIPAVRSHYQNCGIRGCGCET
jgi:hypothetical protein